MSTNTHDHLLLRSGMTQDEICLSEVEVADSTTETAKLKKTVPSLWQSSLVKSEITFNFLISYEMNSL